MRRGDALFGQYVPGTSFLHRMPVGVKYGLVLLPSLVLVIAQRWWLALACTVIFAALLLAARLPRRRSLWVGWGMVVIVGCLAAYNLWAAGWQSAVVVAGNLLACLYASRLLVMTTPGPVLIDALVRAAGPVRHVGLSPERFGLAVAIMVRSIPYLMDSFEQVRVAARARGQERNLLGQVTPVVVDAVAYAHRTGEALAARGLGEDRAR